MKRLIICCDGTWQDLGKEHPTNVVKMIEAIKPISSDGTRQVVYYSEGLGTHQGIPIACEIDKIGGGAFGWGIDHRIQTAYRFLSLNYSEGDEIYLIGFSRGAYIVRALAGLIYNSGLVRRDCIRSIPKAYELYRNRGSDASPNSLKALEFRRENCIPSYPPNLGKDENQGRVTIKALCCWDTVKALGIPDLPFLGIPDLPFLGVINHLSRQRYEFYDHRVSPLIESAFHAVAIDEKRLAFQYIPMEPNDSNTRPSQVFQVWFAGTHGCVGGGCAREKKLSDIALKWMMDNLAQLGLETDKTLVKVGIEPNPYEAFCSHIKNTHRLAGIQPRKIDGYLEDLHESVHQRLAHPTLGYCPENVLDLFHRPTQSRPTSAQQKYPKALHST